MLHDSAARFARDSEDTESLSPPVFSPGTHCLKPRVAGRVAGMVQKSKEQGGAMKIFIEYCTS